MPDNSFELQLQGRRLITAEILYHLPDHLLLLQEYIWQEYDLLPDLPKLRRFLKYWREHLEGPLHSVRYSIGGIAIAPVVVHVPREFRLH